MSEKLTVEEMERAYPELCRRNQDLQSDLECTEDIVARLKEEREELKLRIHDLEMEVMKYKARLYDLTSGEWL